MNGVTVYSVLTLATNVCVHVITVIWSLTGKKLQYLFADLSLCLYATLIKSVFVDLLLFI